MVAPAAPTMMAVILGQLLGQAATGNANAYSVAKEASKAKGLSAIASGLKLMSAPLTATLELLLQIDGTTSALRENFGKTFGDPFLKDLVAVDTKIKDMGTSFEDAAAAIEAAAKGISDFRFLSSQLRQEIAENTLALTRFNVEVGASTEAFETLTESMGLSISEAGKFLRGFQIVQENTSIQASQLVGDFNSLAGQILRYGEDTYYTFTRAAIVSDRLGISTANLISISEGFDTFEGASKSVSGLNQLLGGPFLNTVQMLQETDPVKRIEMIREAVFSAGKSFSTMAEFERKAFAELIPGLGGDVNKLAKILSDMDGDITEGFQTSRNQIESTSNTIDELGRRAGEARSIAETMTSEARQFEFLGGDPNVLLPQWQNFLDSIKSDIDDINGSVARLMQFPFIVGGKLGASSLPSIKGGMFEQAFKWGTNMVQTLDDLLQALGPAGHMFPMLSGIRKALEAFAKAQGIQLAAGGVVTSPIRATIGEFAPAQNEAVIPLPAGIRDLGDFMARANNTGGGVRVHVTFDEFSLKPVVKRIMYDELAGSALG